MKRIYLYFIPYVFFIGCSDPKPNTEANPLLAPYTGAYQGVPSFDQMSIPWLRAALESSMVTHKKEITQLSRQSAPPTFENTIVAYDNSGRDLNRALTYYSIYSSNLSSSEFRTFKKEFAPIIAAHYAEILQNTALFDRIKFIHTQTQKTPLDSVKQRAVHLIYQQFEMSGANLAPEQKKRYKEIQAELSKLYTSFSDNVLADEEKFILVNKRELDGLPDSYISSLAQAAKNLGKEGHYAIPNTRSFVEPLLKYSSLRHLRKRVWLNYYSRGDNDDIHDNNKIISKILKLRHERVQLMGYTNYAEWRLQNRMAKTPENALELLQKVWSYSIKKVDEEVAEMQAIATEQKHNIQIKPWDYRYYSEIVRKNKYNLDSELVKPYLELNQLREAMFYVGGELFDFEFKPAKKPVPVFHPSVKVWEVYNRNTSQFVGLWYLDPYARKGKRSGAWATTYRARIHSLGHKSVLASNNSNFVKPAPGEPVLLSWDDATTLFHEFGHALHFLSGQAAYPILNGGVRDYTEFQSQLLERWLSTDRVISQFLKHHKTKKSMPKVLIGKIKKASTFNQGFATTEYLASAIMDMEYHTTSDLEQMNPRSFEKEVMTKWGLPEQVVMRHRSTHFGHIFSRESYAAAYYGYLWADVLTADAAEAFEKAPNTFYNKPLARKLVKYLFSPRNTLDPQQAYRLFRGRDAHVDALLRDRGFLTK